MASPDRSIHVPESLHFPDASVRARGLQMPTSARGLVIVVHPHGASRRRSGHCFVTDVLHANGLATLAIDLHTAEEQLRGDPAPGLVQMRYRIRAVFDWLSTQAVLGNRPVAMLGIDDAVTGCIAAAARHRPAALRSMVLLDGRPHQVAHLLSRLSLPTMFIVGRCDTRSAQRHRASIRLMTAPSRLELLPLSTRPIAATGAHQAFALAAMGWFAQSLFPGDSAPAPSRGGGAVPAALLDPGGRSSGVGRS